MDKWGVWLRILLRLERQQLMTFIGQLVYLKVKGMHVVQPLLKRYVWGRLVLGCLIDFVICSVVLLQNET